MQAKTSLGILVPADQLSCIKVENLVSDGRKARLRSSVGLLSEAQRQIARIFQLGLNYDFRVVLELNR